MSNRSAGSSEPSVSRAVSLSRWTVRNPGPRPRSTTAITTFKRLGVSNTIPSSTGPTPVRCTRSPVARFSTTRAYRASSTHTGITRVPSDRSPLGRETSRPVLWTDRRHATQTAADGARAGKRSGQRSTCQRSVAASRCPRVRSRGSAGRRRARTVPCRALRLASCWLARRPRRHRRFGRGRAMGEVCTTSCTDGRRRSHRPCWNRRADPASSRPAHRRSAASRTDRLLRRSAGSPCRSRAEMRCNDTLPLAPGPELCRQSSLTRASRTRRGPLFAGQLIGSATRRSLGQSRPGYRFDRAAPPSNCPAPQHRGTEESVVATKWSATRIRVSRTAGRPCTTSGSIEMELCAN